MYATSDKSMGKVLTTLTIKNRIDEANAAKGLIPSEQIRSITLDNVLVDTGATTLCLPAQAIAQLGLELLKEVDVATATGISKARIFQDAKIFLCGREGTFECSDDALFIEWANDYRHYRALHQELAQRLNYAA